MLCGTADRAVLAFDQQTSQVSIPLVDAFFRKFGVPVNFCPAISLLNALSGGRRKPSYSVCNRVGGLHIRGVAAVPAACR